jgi:phage baseplate assembly protein W
MDVAAKYPIVPNAYGSIDTVSEDELIKQSIQDILETPISTRFGREDYGSYIYLLIFEQNDSVLKSLLYYYIESALEKWEKRIKISSINFTISEYAIVANVYYTNLITQQQSYYEFTLNRENR